FYKRLLNFSIKSPALMGNFQEIQSVNRVAAPGYGESIYSFVRWSDHQKLIVIVNFSSEETSEFDLKIPSDVVSKWNLKEGLYQLTDQLYQKNSVQLKISNGVGIVKVKISPSESFIFELK